MDDVDTYLLDIGMERRRRSRETATETPARRTTTTTPRGRVTMTESEAATGSTGDDPGVEPALSRNGALSYMHIPAVDVRAAAAFYGAVVGWTIHNGDTDRPGFSAGNIGGAWVTNQVVSREPGLLPYIYVDHIDEVVERVKAHGGEVVRPTYAEGNLWVATFRDPAGNVMGLWQEGPR
jgi:hypothetical protein